MCDSVSFCSGMPARGAFAVRDLDVAVLVDAPAHRDLELLGPLVKGQKPALLVVGGAEVRSSAQRQQRERFLAFHRELFEPLLAPRLESLLNLWQS